MLTMTQITTANQLIELKFILASFGFLIGACQSFNGYFLKVVPGRLTARPAVAFDAEPPNLRSDDKADQADPQEYQDLPSAQIAAQSLQRDGRCHSDGDDEGHDSS